MEKTKSVFVETFGEYPSVKVLDFILTFDKLDHSKSQVAEETGISRITIEQIWDKLIREGIIAKTRTIGRAEMYQLNKENPVVQTLMELDFKLSSAYARKEINSSDDSKYTSERNNSLASAPVQ